MSSTNWLLAVRGTPGPGTAAEFAQPATPKPLEPSRSDLYQRQPAYSTPTWQPTGGPLRRRPALGLGDLGDEVRYAKRCREAPGLRYEY